jgi:hypothetical protein
MTLEDMFKNLLVFELRLEQQQIAIDTSVGLVNVTPRNDYRSRGGKYPQRQRFPLNQSHGSNNRRRGRGNRGRGPPPNYSSNLKPQCQVCGTTSHTVIQCYCKFDHAYQGTLFNMVAYMTSPSPQHDTNWYLDIGSTNHLTNNFNNLYVRSEPYLGNDYIHVTDGAGFPIKNIGFTTL